MNTNLTFAEYERLASRTDVSPGRDLKGMMVPLLGLAGEVGSLLSEHKKHLREGNRYSVFTDHVAEEIGDILWYLANIASKSGLSLSEIAAENLAKLEVSPPPGAIAAKSKHTQTRRTRFDDGFPPQQRLPLRLRVELREIRDAKGLRLEIYQDGKQLGQPLTDNVHYDDGYRFHDVFHLSYAILIGWSPITRRLLGVKRKSKPRIDEVEDGGRAGVTEEAVSALVFAHAAQHSYFEGATSIDYDLLKTIGMMCSPFEVRARSANEWESAILKSYEVWRQVRDNRGGVFVGDAIAGTVAYEAPRPSTSPPKETPMRTNSSR
ncbi:MAG: nucleoside triphosphate pyrophosphohydrolase family protein [Phycisphaerales bacterium]